MFENKMLRRIFGSKRDEVTGDWRKLHTEELHNAYSSTNIIRKGRAVAQRLDAGFPPRRPGFVYGQHVGFVVDKTALGQVFSGYFRFPCQSFRRFLHYHKHPGLTQ
jgi:hypothetical protein